MSASNTYLRKLAAFKLRSVLSDARKVNRLARLEERKRLTKVGNRSWRGIQTRMARYGINFPARQCSCGSCRTCKNREAVRRYKARNRDRGDWYALPDLSAFDVALAEATKLARGK